MPTEPTPLDLATLAIAVAGVVIGLFSLYLTVRRDRAAGKVGVRIVVSAGVDRYYTANKEGLRVTLSNPERRAVTIQRAGLIVDRDDAKRTEFEGWDMIPPPSGGMGMVSAFYGGLYFESGDPAHTVKARMYKVRAATYPKVPRWVWCEDSIGGVHWAAIPTDVQAIIPSVKMHALKPADTGGLRRSEMIEDADITPATELDVGQSR
jgi:hypothetical protein